MWDQYFIMIYNGTSDTIRKNRHHSYHIIMIFNVIRNTIYTNLTTIFDLRY